MPEDPEQRQPTEARRATQKTWVRVLGYLLALSFGGFWILAFAAAAIKRLIFLF